MTWLGVTLTLTLTLTRNLALYLVVPDGGGRRACRAGLTPLDLVRDRVRVRVRARVRDRARDRVSGDEAAHLVRHRRVLDHLR